MHDSPASPANHADEARVGPVGHRPREQRLARPGGSVHEHALGGIDPELDKLLGVQHRQLDHLPHLLNLFLGPPDVAVRDVRLLLNRHHCYARVNLGRERDLDLVLGAVDSVKAYKSAVEEG